MTNFVKADIPASINTIEKLHVWSAEVLQHLYPNATVINFLNDDGEPVESRVVEANKFFYTAVVPPEWRHSSRASIRITNQHQVSGHIWDHALDLGQLPIPAEMKV